MELKQFIEKIKNSKLSNKETSQYHIKLKTNKEHTKQKIYSKCFCKYCHNETIKEISISFFKPKHLTIFEVGLIYALYGVNRKPKDYAQYHKCIAGQEFIKNIKEINPNQNI